MRALKCDFCGANLVMDKSREFATCEFCGTKYLKETIQEKIQEIRGQVSIVGAVETVTGNAEKERLIKNAETYMSINEFDKAVQTYKQITQQFPEDFRGWWGIFSTYTDMYFQTKRFTRFDIQILFNSRKLCKDQSIIDNYLNTIPERYGSQIRLSKNSYPYISIAPADVCSYAVDTFTIWLIYQLSSNQELLTPSLKEFCTSITNQYAQMIRAGEIIPVLYFNRPPLYTEEWNINLNNVDIIAITRFLAKKYSISYFCQNTVTPTGEQINTFRLSNGVVTLDYTQICDIIGRWAIFEGNNAKILALLHFPISNKNYCDYFNICPHCGGRYNGIIKKVCSQCGKPKE